MSTQPSDCESLEPSAQRLAKTLHPLGLCITEREALSAVVDMAEIAMAVELDLKDDHADAAARQSINHCTAALHGH